MNNRISIITALIWVSLIFGEKQVKIGDIATDQDTAILIKKGPQPILNQCTEYQLIDGKDEINGIPDYDKSKSYVSWQIACKEWKISMKEMNKENQVLILNCNRPQTDKEGDTYLSHSLGYYKIRVKIKDNK